MIWDSATVAQMVWAEVFDARSGVVLCDLPDGSSLTFKEGAVAHDAPNGGPSTAVQLADLLTSEQEATRVSTWLGCMFGGRVEVRELDSGWSALAEREDGRLLEIGAFGYIMHQSWQAFADGGRVWGAALRRVVDS